MLDLSDHLKEIHELQEDIPPGNIKLPSVYCSVKTSSVIVLFDFITILMNESIVYINPTYIVLGNVIMVIFSALVDKYFVFLFNAFHSALDSIF